MNYDNYCEDNNPLQSSGIDVRSDKTLNIYDTLIDVFGSYSKIQRWLKKMEIKLGIETDCRPSTTFENAKALARDKSKRLRHARAHSGRTQL